MTAYEYTTIKPNASKVYIMPVAEVLRQAPTMTLEERKELINLLLDTLHNDPLPKDHSILE